MISCKPSVPSEYIQPDDMEDLIYDYHVAQGIAAQQEGNQDYNRRLTFELVLKKHGLTQAEFDSSLVYYYTRADRFQEIYKHVQERLNTEAEKYGAAVGDVQIAAASLSGDTADVWKGNRALLLFNDRPYHLYQFAQKADTAYRAGDSFMLSMNTTWLMQQGNRQASVYMAVTYANDSTVTVFYRFVVGHHKPAHTLLQGACQRDQGLCDVWHAPIYRPHQQSLSAVCQQHPAVPLP